MENEKMVMEKYILCQVCRNPDFEICGMFSSACILLGLHSVSLCRHPIRSVLYSLCKHCTETGLFSRHILTVFKYLVHLINSRPRQSSDKGTCFTNPYIIAKILYLLHL